jgi:hypothetical protein
VIEDARRERIAHVVIQVLRRRFDTFPEDATNVRNTPFHEAFLHAFQNKLEGKVTDIPYLISVNSWLQGLNTSLGQTFFESAAHILSDGEKRAFAVKQGTHLTWTSEQQRVVSDIIQELKSGLQTPDLERETNWIRDMVEYGDVNVANNFTADVFIEEGDKICAIELKSVKPNAGEMRGEKEKILQAKAALIHQYPTKKISFYLGFPFDPTSDTPTGSDKSRFLRSIVDGAKYFHQDEVLLASELWDFLSGHTNAMEELIEIINKIAIPEFLNLYNFIGDHSNRSESPEQYRQALFDWYLYSEVKLVDNDELIQQNLTMPHLKRVYNQSVFHTTKYEYNTVRCNTLLELLS